ncbi:hypothetical protein ATE92_0563 [Ulvibacter sp. MAR_2010_11]|uniref:ATP-binding protein n=1 Tax=Ulvibacter sp. MAR_2010_11 TaxID=1250229 RepID=UPI000C2CAAE8|nr:ATP-binding protein [Ulvibacter sp. MAR_2010_11]PKA82434.1 hypothetical protein ATE92_0563 [Ulvibacter sp. MAR_2010_11]
MKMGKTIKKNISAIPHDSFLRNAGEMGQLIRAKNWGDTVLGPMENWPQSLKTGLSILLHSKFPKFLFWGPDLICFYNDAFRPSLGKEGKHPDMLGSRGEDYWGEIWDIIKPLIDQVLDGYEAVWSEDQLIPIYRNGAIENVYWTFSYSPISDESGKVAGVWVTCIETTQKVFTMQELEESKDQLHFAIEAANLATWDYNPKLNLFRANKRLQEWFNLDGPDINPEIAYLSVCEIDRERVRKAIEWAMTYESGGAYDITYLLYEKNSVKKRVVRAIGRAWFNENKEVYRFNGILQDVTEQHVAEAKVQAAMHKLSESEIRFRNVANSAPVLIKMTDDQARIRFVNKLWLDFTGRAADYYLGSTALMDIHQDERETTKSKYEVAFKLQKEYRAEYRVKRKDGSYRWISNIGVPRFTEDGNFEGYIHALMDIHDIKMQEHQKDLFIGMASHELKTPVTSIKGYTQVLQSAYKDSDDKLLKSSLDIIDKQIRVLTNLISDLLDLSKMKTGGLDLNFETFNLNNLIVAAIREMKLINPTYEFTFVKGEGTTIVADKNRIRQVLINLLTNAVKYSPHSKLIEIKSIFTKNTVSVHIRDFGIGIKKENQKKIFDRFFREEGKDEKTFPGFGIGLYIASDIIKKHKGTIGVKSEKGKGSDFHITIPIVKS